MACCSKSFDLTRTSGFSKSKDLTLLFEFHCVSLLLRHLWPTAFRKKKKKNQKPVSAKISKYHPTVALCGEQWLEWKEPVSDSSHCLAYISRLLSGCEIYRRSHVCQRVMRRHSNLAQWSWSLNCERREGEGTRFLPSTLEAVLPHHLEPEGENGAE